MALFVALAVLLTIAVAVLFAWPLRRRATTQFAGIAITIAVLTAGLYLLIGTPAALDPAAREAPQTMREAIAQLQAELRRNPQQAEGWLLLGRALAQQQQFAQSRDAYARAADLLPDNNDVQVEYAEASALAHPQRRFDANAVALLQGVLERDPRHQRGRWFLGIAQRQAGEDAAAAQTWEPLLEQVDARTAASLRPQIDAARADAGLAPLPPAAESAGANALTVNVALDPEFAARVRLPANASVFVIARVPDGPAMPVAVEKHPLQALPLTIILDDGDSPMPTQKLSALQEVELIARLSASGNAIRQQGDLESQPVRVTLPATEPVDLIIVPDP